MTLHHKKVIPRRGFSYLSQDCYCINISEVSDSVVATRRMHRIALRGVRGRSFGGLRFPARRLQHTPILSLEEEIAVIKSDLATDKAWSLTPLAKEAFGAGSVSSEPVEARDMSEYMKERGFSQAAEDPRSSAYRMLSAAMTFPLTLGYGVNKIFAKGGPLGGMAEFIEMEKRPLRVLVVGARAESSLPALWWRECLLSCFHSGAISGGIDIGLMGPGLQQMKASPNNSITFHMHPPRFSGDNQDTGAKGRAYHIQEGQAFLHNHPEHMKLMLQADLFVLFNPGLGHPALCEGWEDTIKLLCMSRKPVLCTAHSVTDLQRDKAFLEATTNTTDAEEQDLGEPLEFLFEAHQNPFASAKRTYDDKEEEGAQIVTTNQYIHCWRGK